MGPTIIAILIVLAVGYCALATLSALKDRRLKNERRDWTVEDFVGEFADTAYPEQAVRDSFEDFLSYCRISVRRHDRLDSPLGLVFDDIEDMLAWRCEKNGIEHKNFLDGAYAQFPLRTVEDYVRLLGQLMDASGKIEST